MIYDYLTFEFIRTLQEEYTFHLSDYSFSDTQLGKNMKMSICQFQVRHDGFLEDRNPVSLVLNSPNIRNLGTRRVICLETGHIKPPIFRLDAQPKYFSFSMKDMLTTDKTWTHVAIIIEISYEEKEDYFKDAIMKKM